MNPYPSLVTMRPWLPSLIALIIMVVSVRVLRYQNDDKMFFMTLLLTFAVILRWMEGCSRSQVCNGKKFSQGIHVVQIGNNRREKCMTKDAIS